MMNIFATAYRFLPPFKGKKRLGKFFFKKLIFKKGKGHIRCKNGLKMYIMNTYDSVGRALFFDGYYEPKTVKCILKNTNKGDVMVDVGANIGAISLVVAKKKEVKIYAFEPGKQIFKTLQENITLNHITNVEALPLALSDKTGATVFYESDRVHGWSGIVKIDGFQHYTVAATTLDTFAKENNIEKIAVLKVDVQGWEYFVLKGAEELINQKRIAHIIFEFEWWAEKNAGLQIGSAQEFLLKKGFSLYTLEGKRINKPLVSGTCLIHAKI